MKPYFGNGTLFWDLKSIDMPVQCFPDERSFICPKGNSMISAPPPCLITCDFLITHHF